MQHYWGALAICTRIGYTSTKRLPELIKRLGVPAFLRKHARKKTCYYASEAMLLSWELSRGRQYREELIAKQQRHDQAKAEQQQQRSRILAVRQAQEQQDCMQASHASDACKQEASKLLET